MQRMIFDLVVNKKVYKIQAGQRFYHNNYSTTKGHCLPDYLIIQNVRCYDAPSGTNSKKGYFIIATYENHGIYTKERVFDARNLLPFSSLNPELEDPMWVFVDD